MSESVDDTTQLPDTTRPFDSTQLSDSTHLPDATYLASTPHTDTTPSTESAPQSIVLSNLPQQPLQALPEGPSPITDAASIPAGSDSTVLKPRKRSTPAIPQQTTAQFQPQSRLQYQSNKVAQIVTSALPASINSGLLLQPTAQVRGLRQPFNALIGNVSRAIIGRTVPIKQCVIALVVDGHILLEDNPGTGRTQLVRGLVNSIFTGFKHVQSTPDLLSSDVVGVTFHDQKREEFEFCEGPIFAFTVLADEISRASPRTQSALLGAMGEQKVTVDDVTHDVPQPFIVIATQNLVERLGTYKLPEAQMGRFPIKTSTGYPGRDVSVDIPKQVDTIGRTQTTFPMLNDGGVVRLRQMVTGIYVDDAVCEYIVRLIKATRHNEKITVGSSMCGALALTRCARIWAATDSRTHVAPDNVKDLTMTLLVHRTTLTPEATFNGATPENLIAQALEDVPSPTIGP